MKSLLFTLLAFLFTSYDLNAQVFINRTKPINSSEVFGFSKSITLLSPKYGGMYIETTGSRDGRPFYGYAINGAVKAYQYFNGNDNGLHTYNLGDKVSIWQDSMQWKIDEDTRLFYNGAKLEFGKNGNTFLGKGVTPADVSTNTANTVIGWLSARIMTGGVSNTIVGFRSAENLTSGDFNTIVGSENANQLTMGSKNTLLGYRAGWNSGFGATGNVFIGYRAGYNNITSNKLIISNSETTTPLIEGNFATPQLKINGETRIEGETLMNGPAAVAGNLGVIGQAFASSVNLNGTFPSVDFQPNGTSKFYIQYDPSDDELNIHRTGFGDVLKIKNNGKIFIPAIATNAQAQLDIKSTGELVANNYPTIYEYFFLEELNTPNSSGANMIVVKDPKNGDVINRMVVMEQWAFDPIGGNPSYYTFNRMNKFTRATEEIGAINPPNTNHNQEYSTTINHTIDTTNYIYFFLVDEDSNTYTYLRLIK